MGVNFRNVSIAVCAGAVLLTGDGLAGAAPATPTAASTTGAAGFDSAVKPLVNKNCSGCHNQRLASGGLDITALLTPDSPAAHREQWERIVQKLRTGEMPPKPMPKPAQPQIDAFVKFVQGEWDKADRNAKPDPGRVTARRLNRVEYTNTIRDLLAVDFRADRNFPTDDSGYGFDNIADVLTISPVLMEKYMDAAESIAARAIGANPLPKKPLEVLYHTKDKNIRRLDVSTVEATHRVEFDGEYTARIGMPGERAKDAKPVKLAFYMDGKVIDSATVDTKPSNLVYFDPYSEHEFRVYLPEGDHVFRAQFLDDDFVKQFKTDKEAYDRKKNKFLQSITFIGPYPSKVERASRKKILICDPKTGGDPCMDKIVSALARRAWRRPVSRAEIASLMKFVRQAKAEGLTPEQGLQSAIQAMLVSPHFLFRIERDPAGPAKPISEVELASRISYFLWSSMPDDELLDLAVAGKLRANLDAQVKRVLDDPKSSALADNFASQWLETRNLDFVKPDPQKFPEWTPDLREAMKTETRMFFEHVLRQNRPISEFIDARYTFLNEFLAKYYGVPDVKGPDFRLVELATDQRGGILSHASVLTVSSYPTRTSPVIRGKYVLNNILGTPPPPPPPDVPPLEDAGVGEKVSLRQQMEKHRTNAICASCHNRMDVLGFGLENYNGIGKWRTHDGKFPIDVAGTMPNGKSFSTPAEMRTLLKEDLPQVAHCLTEKMMTYAIGRGMQPFDRRAMDEVGRKLADSDYKFQTLIYEVVRSLPFQQRRGEPSGVGRASARAELQLRGISNPNEVAQK